MPTFNNQIIIVRWWLNDGRHTLLASTHNWWTEPVAAFIEAHIGRKRVGPGDVFAHMRACTICDEMQRRGMYRAYVCMYVCVRARVCVCIYVCQVLSTVLSTRP